MSTSEPIAILIAHPLAIVRTGLAALFDFRATCMSWPRRPLD